MNIGKVIYSKLNSIASTFPVTAPQGTTGNHIVYHVIDVVPAYAKETTSVFDDYRIQVDIYSNSYSGVMTLSDSVRTALDRVSGTIEGVEVSDMRFDGAQDAYEISTDEFGVSQDYIIKVRP